ncbi:AAA family ATPase [Vibrio navarrensis]
MYVKKIDLENIKTFKRFAFELDENENPAGWHVILGNNGAGKSTFIRAAAVGLMGPNEANKSRHAFLEWVKKGTDSALIRMELIQDRNLDNWAQKGKQQVDNLSYTLKITDEGSFTTHSRNSPNRHVWSGKKGWFSVSYGPFRRFSGGNSDYQKLFYSSPLLARHLSVFGEDIALTETLEWLKELRFKELEKPNSIEANLLKKIKNFVNQDDFLPNGVKFEGVSSDGIEFIDSNKTKVNIESLSDGYRSVLSMTLELIRQMVDCYETEDIFSSEGNSIVFPGVVFIDEVDVHLHPIWQRKIGKWFTKHFPKIQFIVSTHSPLVCQSASSGSIWKLPNFIENKKGYRVRGMELNRLLYGNILEALSSDVFGIGIERSEEAQELLKQLAELNVKAQFGSELTEEEFAEKQRIQSIFGTNV